MTACWIWTGRIKNDTPYLYFDGKDTTARQALYRALIDKKAPPVLKPRCGVHMCVNPHHMEGKNKGVVDG